LKKRGQKEKGNAMAKMVINLIIELFSYGNMYMYFYMYMNIYMHYMYIMYVYALPKEMVINLIIELK